MFVILVVLFVPETAYIRASIEERYADVNQRTSDAEKRGDEGEKDLSTTEQSHVEIAPPASAEKKDSYIKSLRFISGRYSDAPFWKILIRPVVIFWYPAVLWAFLIYGTTLTWIVVFSVVNASIFTLPPYNFTVSQVGLISISPFIMTIIGEVIAGPLNDYICLVLAKRNHGIYEPEFRLVLMFPVLLLGITGFFGFGACVHYQTHWIGPILTFGFANMAMAFANGCVFGYVIDSYEDLSEEGTLHCSATFGAFADNHSFRCHQCSKSAYIWTDLLCQRLAGKRRCSCSLQCPGKLLYCRVHVDSSAVDFWEAYAKRDCS